VLASACYSRPGGRDTRSGAWLFDTKRDRFGVAALPAGRAVRAGQAVTLLPVPQPCGGNPGPPGNLADGQHRRTSAGVPGRTPGIHHADDRRLITVML
jgi:hypothetical protein